MPSVLDLAELANAAYSFAATVEVSRTPPPRPGAAASALGASSSSAAAPAWCEAPGGGTGGLLGSASSSSATSSTAWSSSSSTSSGGLLASPTRAPRRWTLQQRWPQSEAGGGGFAAALYQAEDTREKVLAYRGTNPNELSDLYSDAQIGIGAVPAQTFPAFAAFRQSGLGETEYLTGHSLGGALAVLISAEARRRAVTFNAPGVMDSCLQLESETTPLPGLLALIRAAARCSAGERVRNYRVGGDPVSSWLLTGMQSGTDAAELDASQCGVLDGLCRHSMETVLAALRRDESSYVDLR